MSANENLEELDANERVQRRRGLFEDQCEWVARQVIEGSHATKYDFEQAFKGDKAAEKNDWSRVSRGVQAALKGAGIHAEIDDNHCLRLLDASQRRYENNSFQPYQYAREKNKIGWLVAHYLKHRNDRHVLLGSGSTVFHVGLNMKRIGETKGGIYSQLFWTVNVALASMWCEGNLSPVARIQIPKGELRTDTYRYASMENPNWNCPIAVVGADGCYYHDGSSSLYANEESVAHNTNYFAKSALDSVICCIVSNKLEYNDNEGQNAGPPIHGPSREVTRRGQVKWYLVTDKKIDTASNPKVKALVDSGWKLVSDLNDWATEPGKEIKEIIQCVDESTFG